MQSILFRFFFPLHSNLYNERKELILNESSLIITAQTFCLYTRNAFLSPRLLETFNMTRACLLSCLPNQPSARATLALIKGKHYANKFQGCLKVSLLNSYSLKLLQWVLSWNRLFNTTSIWKKMNVYRRKSF